MKWRWRISILVAACAAMVIVAVIAWPREREREPEYKGKKLSEWIHGLVWIHPRLPVAMRPTVLPDQPERIEAVQHIGTNAIPYFLTWIEHGKPPRPASKLDTIAIKVLYKGAAQTWLQFRSRRFSLAIDAQSGIGFLGSNASPAVPELIRLSHSTDSFVAGVALGALGSIESKVSPELRESIHAATRKPQVFNYTNSPTGVSPGRFAVGHIWRTNSQVRAPEETQAYTTNSH